MDDFSAVRNKNFNELVESMGNTVNPKIEVN